MIEVLVCEDQQLTAELYQKHGICQTADKLAVRAMCGAECLGYCLFSLSDGIAIVHAVEPAEDVMLADGLLRSALHVGTERGITEAFYSDANYEALYKKINFLEDATDKRLRLQNLFSESCCCKKGAD